PFATSTMRSPACRFRSLANRSLMEVAILFKPKPMVGRDFLDHLRRERIVKTVLSLGIRDVRGAEQRERVVILRQMCDLGGDGLGEGFVEAQKTEERLYYRKGIRHESFVLEFEIAQG